MTIPALTQKPFSTNPKHFNTPPTSTMTTSKPAETIKKVSSIPMLPQTTTGETPSKTPIEKNSKVSGGFSSGQCWVKNLNIKMNKINTDVKMPVTLTTRVDDELAKLIDEIARKEGMDRSTVIRRFLSEATQDWLIDRALKDYEEGRVTLWEAATKCGLSLWEMIEAAKKREVRVPYTLDELKEDLKVL